MMMFGRNQHNAVKQLSSNLKKKNEPRTKPFFNILPTVFLECRLCLGKNKTHSTNTCGLWEYSFTHTVWASLVAQLVKNPPAMQETSVQFPGQEGPLEKEMETHSSILSWEIPWTEEPGGVQTMGS